jgi:hypothetical protein
MLRLISNPSRTRSNGNKDHEERSLGVSVADRRGYGWEPLLWVAVELILDDFVVVQRDADNQSAEEGRCIGI